MTEGNTSQIRLELTPDTSLDDLIKFAELAKRYGSRGQTDIVHPTEGSRERKILVFNPMPSKVEPDKTNPRTLDHPALRRLYR